MNPHIHHHNPGADMFCTDEARTARCHHQHLGLTGQGRQIPCAGMCHAHRCLAGLQHQGHRLAHQDAAPHDNGPLSLQIHIGFS